VLADIFPKFNPTVAKIMRVAGYVLLTYWFLRVYVWKFLTRQGGGVVIETNPDEKEPAS
jgi:hypothetical protein